MADLYEITLANGIPVAGDGDVKTINSLMEDGALAGVGRLSDAASASTDFTPASMISILKMVSKVLQDMRLDWPDSLGAGGGLKIDSSGMPILVSGNLTVTQMAGTVSSVSFASGTVAYSANDVVGAGGGNGALQFSAVAPGVTALQIITASLEIDRAAIISGETTYRLYLYNVTPPSALADNAAFDLSATDRAAFLGYIDFPVLGDHGSTLYVELNNINKVIKTVSQSIFGYLVTVGPFTPVASNYKITLGSRQL